MQRYLASSPRFSSRLTSRVVALLERAVARDSCCMRMCQPSCRFSTSRTVYSTTDSLCFSARAFSSMPSIRLWAAVRVRQPCACVSGELLGRVMCFFLIVCCL